MKRSASDNLNIHIPAVSTDTAGYGADDVLRTALDVGEHILKNGGEISRVESTIEHIGFALGAVHVEAFAITNLITASVRMKDGTFSQQMRHVTGGSTNLYRVEELNRISRELCNGKIDISTAQTEISAVNHSHELPKFITKILGNALGASGFTLFFGGSLIDSAISGVIGVVACLLTDQKIFELNSLAQLAIRSFLSGILSILSVKSGLGANADLIMIGTIMLLIPGLSFGKSISDMLDNNLISGSLRLIQSLILATIIALGYSAAILLLGGTGQ